MPIKIEGREISRDLDSFFEIVAPRGAKDITYSQALKSLDIDGDGIINITKDSEKFIAMGLASKKSKSSVVGLFSSALDVLCAIEEKMKYPGVGVVNRANGNEVIVIFAKNGYMDLPPDDMRRYHKKGGSTAIGMHSVTRVGIEPTEVWIEKMPDDKTFHTQKVRVSMVRKNKRLSSIELFLNDLTRRDGQFKLEDDVPRLISRDLKRYLWDFASKAQSP